MRVDLEAGAKLRRVVIVARNPFDAVTCAQVFKLCLKRRGLRSREPIGEIADMGYLAAFDQQEAERSRVVAFDVSANHGEGTATVEGAIRHKQAVVAEALSETPFGMPPVDRGEDLKGGHMGELPRFDCSTVQDHLFDRVAGFALVDHGGTSLNAPRGVIV